MNDIEKIDTLWILLCAILVFLMQAGFMCIEAGATRNKNNINTALNNICDFGISVLGFWAVGYGIMYGLSANNVIGTTKFFVQNESIEEGSWDKACLAILEYYDKCYEHELKKIEHKETIDLSG